MPVQLTPAQALDPKTIERVAAAEWAYDEVMAGRWPGIVDCFHQLLNEAERDNWRAKARELLTDLVTEST